MSLPLYYFFFFFNDTATTEIYTLSLHDALPILVGTVNLSIDRLAVRARAYATREVLDAFRHRFEVVGLWGVPAIIPPHYLHRLLGASGGLRTAWENLDRRVNSRWPFRFLGSHTAWLFKSRP